MKKHFISALSLSLWSQLKIRWTNLCHKITTSNCSKPEEAIKELNHLGFRLGLTRKLTLVTVGGLMTLGVHAQTFTEQTGLDNPFSTLEAGSNLAPVFIDVDGDNDLDLVSGEHGGDLNYFENVDGAFVIKPSTNNPFYRIGSEFFSTPTFVDVDGDSDLDLVFGGYLGKIEYYKNTEGFFTSQRGEDNPFNFIDKGVNGSTSPEFIDLDGDNDLDLVSGGSDGAFLYFQNDNGVYTEKTGTDNPFDGLDAGSDSQPTFVDLDGDNDLDLISGNNEGTFKYYQNSNGAFIEKTGLDNPLDGFDVDFRSNPTFVDLDGDTDLDLVSGSGTEGFKYYINNTVVIGINDQLLEVISMYPNPAVNQIFINTVGPYKIKNMYGIVLLSGEVSESEIDVSSLNEGQYIINVEGAVRTFVKK